MKQKIKIMKNQPQPSDEEIKRYMNFDHVLASRNVVSGWHQMYSALKWGVPCLLLTGLLLWFAFSKEPGKTVETQKHNEKAVSPKQSSISPKPVDADSMHNAEPTDQEGSIAKPAKAKKQATPPPASKAAKDEIYMQAEPQVGYAALYNYFAENLRYPSDAIADSIQGVQTISFIINTNGTPEYIMITNSLGDSFDKEARRLIETMPAWKPATLNGIPVASKVSLPLTFQIQHLNK
jgi:TonB family protein